MTKIAHHKWEECSYESLPQWVKHRLRKRAVQDEDPHYSRNLSVPLEEGFLRGRSFFYVYQLLGTDKRRVTHPDCRGIESQMIYYRKLRHKSNEVCRYFLVYDCSSDTRHQYILSGDLRVTEDIMRSQDWLDGLAQNEAAVDAVYEFHGSEVDRGCCGGDWCPRYEPVKNTEILDAVTKEGWGKKSHEWFYRPEC